jgi:hypothetical protein
MADHFDTALEMMRQSLTQAYSKAENGDWMAYAEIDAIKTAIADLEAEASFQRSKSPEQLAAEQADRAAYWEAFEKAANASNDDDQEEDD